MKFKVGQKVKRISSWHGNVQVGDVVKVVEVNNFSGLSVILKGKITKGCTMCD